MIQDLKYEFTDLDTDLDRKLFAAVERLDLGRIKKILKTGARADAVDDNGWSSLHLLVFMAVHAGAHSLTPPTAGQFQEMLRLLQRNGADINAVIEPLVGGVHDATPLALAGAGSHAPILRDLIAAGANVRAKGVMIHTIEEGGDEECVRILFAAGGDVEEAGRARFLNEQPHIVALIEQTRLTRGAKKDGERAPIHGL